MITAVGGGIARDVLANRVPVVLEGGWYATPALVGAAWAAFAHDQGWSTRRRAPPRHRGLLHLAGAGPASRLVAPAARGIG